MNHISGVDVAADREAEFIFSPNSMVRASTVDLTVQLGRTEITGERLIYLKPGDVIQLDQNANETLSALVEGVPKLKGFAGVQRGFQAFKVNNKLSLQEGKRHG